MHVPASSLAIVIMLTVIMHFVTSIKDLEEDLSHE